MAAIILAAWWAATAVAGELPYVLKDRTPDVVGMEFAVDPDRAYLTARDYGLNPDRGEVFIILRQNQTYGLHWEVGYTDWSKEDGINTYLIDADSGAVVSVFVTSSPRTKKRTEFAINPAEAQVDSVFGLCLCTRLQLAGQLLKATMGCIKRRSVRGIM